MPARLPGADHEEPDEVLVVRARAGDDIALEQLLRRHRGLVRGQARRHFLVGAEPEDLAQEAMIGLFLAVRAFDEGLGASFRSFAEVCVSRQVVTAVRAATRRKHGPLNDYVSLQCAAAPGSDDDRTLEDVLPAPRAADPAEQLVHAERLAALRDHVDRAFSDLEVEVLRLHVEGVGYRDIAATLHRGQKSVDNALQRVRRKVAEHLVERELEIA